MPILDASRRPKKCTKDQDNVRANNHTAHPRRYRTRPSGTRRGAAQRRSLVHTPPLGISLRQRPPLPNEKGPRLISVALVFLSRAEAYAMYCPPFADRVEPVTKPASSDARKVTARAISEASPRRPTGICGRITSFMTFSGIVLIISVLM